MNELTSKTTRPPGARDASPATGPGGLGSSERESREQQDHDRERHEARKRLAETGERLKGEARRATDGLRHRAAEEVRSLGAAANAAADRLDEDDHERTGAYARGLCSACEGAADYLAHADLSGVQRDLAGFARRNPALFLGGAVLLGLAAGRLVSASPPRPRHEGFDDEHSDFEPHVATRREPRGQDTTRGYIPASASPVHTTGVKPRSSTPLSQEGTSHEHRS